MEPTTQPPVQSPTPVQPVDKKVGPIIASLIIVLVLIFIALYLFASRITTPVIPDDATASDTDQTYAAQGVKPVTSTSTDVKALKADLDASTNGLDNQNF